MGKYKKGQIGRRQKQKKYDKEAIKEQKKKQWNENLLIIKRDARKSILKKVSNIKDIPYEPEPKIIDLMNMDAEMTEEELKKLLKVEEKVSEYNIPIDPKEPQREFKVDVPNEHKYPLEPEAEVEKLQKRINYLKRNRSSNNLNKKKTYILNTMRRFSDICNNQIKEDSTVYDRTKHFEKYRKIFTYRAFKKKYILFKGLSGEAKRKRDTIYKAYFNTFKKNHIEKMMDFDLIVYHSNKKKKVSSKVDYDYSCLGNFDDDGKFIEENETKNDN